MRRMATVLAALAGFVPLPLPPGASPDDSGAISEFAASGDTWIARTNAQARVQLTTDAGASWRAIDLGTGAGVGIAVGPDGAFWLPSSRIGEGQRALVHVSKEGLVSSQPIAVGNGLLSAPAWDDKGRMWVALVSGASEPATVSAIRLNADGSVAEQVDGKLPRGDFPFIRFVGATAYVGANSGTLRLAGGKLVLIAGFPSEDDTEFSQAQLWPVDSVGNALVTFHAVSPDGGESFVYTDRQQYGVHGNPDLLMRFPLADQPAAFLLKRCGPFVFCDTGVEVPRGTAALWQTPSGLVAVSAESAGSTPLFGQHLVFAINRDAVPRQAPDSGKVSRASHALMARINFHRRRAGLPPLIEDARMTAAALAHARYLKRHVRRGKLDIENAHHETSGQAGFTGVDPVARCYAKGTACNGEEVIPGRRPSDAIVSLYYHRTAMMSPYTQYGGAAVAGNYAVYNVDTERQAFVIKPSGYPSGRYDGPLSLQGPEAPDPYALCRPSVFDPQHWHGVPISFVPPGREAEHPHPNVIQIRFGPDVKVLDLKLYIGKRRIPGCLNSGTFLPKPAFRPHTKYTARARWRPSPKAGVKTYTWTFRTR